ncbi:MAG: hypothetical protein P8123_03775 [bacterium]
MKNAMRFFWSAILLYVLSNVNPVLSYGDTPPTLSVFATTMTQIVLQWEDPNSNTVSYKLQRDTDDSFDDPTEYVINQGTAAFNIKIFSDTNRQPGSKNQFKGEAGSPLLDEDTTYYYRIIAILDTEEEVPSESVSANVSGPVRGEEGDLWADVILGKPDFTQIQMGKTTPYESQHTAGILIDRTGEFDRMYIKDLNNNRILGFEGIPTPASEPDLVLGQPDFYSSGSNGDSAWQTFPYRVPASASSLCLMPPDQISITEVWLISTMAVDENANLFVVDEYNHRVLKYDDPFENDRIADGVWGQADFVDNQPNRGQSSPSNNSLRFKAYGAVDVDYLGNLWVADFINCRVLRFPKQEDGTISQDANLVFGQLDFTSAGVHPDSTGHTATYGPTGVRTVKQDNDDVWVYVSMLTQNGGGPGRIVVFKPPFENGMQGQVINKEEMDPLSIKMDIDSEYLWVVIGGHYVLRMELATGDIVKRIYVGIPGGATPTEVDVDREGNLYVVTHEVGVYRYVPPDYDPVDPPGPRGPLGVPVFGINNVVISADSMNQCKGSTTFGDQLVVADECGRVLMWSYYHNLIDGQAANDLYGKNDFSSTTKEPGYAFPQTDTQDRLWVNKSASTTTHWLVAFNQPLTNSSTPIKTICLTDGSLPVLGGGTISISHGSTQSFAIVGSGDEIWVADEWNSRVFRISNIDGGKDPEQEPYVDIVLGQSTLAGTTCNQGSESPTASTLCLPQNAYS